MKNREYWAKRFEQLQESLLIPADEYIKELENAYRLAQREIEKEIAVWYQRFADNNGIADMAEARRLLNSDELEEFKWDVYEYIKYGRENAVNQKWVKELENASARVHINSLEALKLQTRQAVEKLYGGMESKVSKLNKDIYSESYLKTAYEMAKGSGVGQSIFKLNEDMLDKTIRKPWAVDGKNFSERIWGYKETAVNTIYQEINKGLISGKTVDEMSKSLAKAAHVKESSAKRLVLTESAYFSSLGSQESFEKLGVEKFEVLGTLDNTTCGECGGLDGKVYDMKDYEVGVTAPPFHCNCRCTTIPYFDDEFTEGETRAARGEDGKTTLVENMTYEEWKERFIEDESKENEKNFIPDIKFSTKMNTNITKEQRTEDLLTVSDALAELPAKVRYYLADTIFEFGWNGSACDIENRIIRVGIGAKKEDIFHEFGHLVENYMMDKNTVEEYKKYLIEDLSINDIIKETYYTNQNKPLDIFLLNGPNFETEYQSRLYIEKMEDALNSDGTINTDVLLECISEPFRKYMNGEEISKVVLEIIERVIL